MDSNSRSPNAGPAQPPSSFGGARVFVSSTFSGMDEERDALATHAFPSLRNLCEQRGVAFNDIDLRWGITEEEMKDYLTVERCLDAVDRSNVFIGIVKDRYGSTLRQLCHSFDNLPAETRQNWPWLQDSLDVSLTELEMEHGVFRNAGTARPAFFYVQQPPPSSAPPSVTRLIKRIRSSNAVVADFDSPATLADRVRDDLWRLFEKSFGPKDDAAELEYERRRQANLSTRLAQLHVGRDAQLTQLDRGTKPILIAGERGTGKTALLGKWLADLSRGERRLAGSHFDRLLAGLRILGRPVDCFFRLSNSYADRRLADLLRSIMLDLRAKYSLSITPPERAGHVKHVFGDWLRKLPTDRTVVIAIDGVDDLVDAADAWRGDWIPKSIPRRVQLVLTSALPAAEKMSRERGFSVARLGDLTEDDCKNMVAIYLNTEFVRNLESDVMQRLVHRSTASNPQLLTIVCDELHQRRYSRMGETEREAAWKKGLADAVDAYLPERGTSADAYSAMLDRLEQDYPEPAGMTRSVFQLMAASRRGLAEAEVQDIAADNSRVPAAKLAPVIEAARRWLVEYDGRLAIHRPDLRTAVVERCVGGGFDEARRRLVEYFGCRPPSPRVADEAPWQLAMLSDWDGLAGLLSDLQFLENTPRAFRYELCDYWHAIHDHTGHKCSAVVEAVRDSAESSEGLFGVAARLAIDLDDIERGHSVVDRWIIAAESDGDEASLLEPLLLKGDIFHRMREWAMALACYKKHEELASRSSALKREQVASQLRQCAVFFECGEVDAAWPALQRLETVQSDDEDYEGLAENFGLQGQVLESRGQLKEALGRFEEQERSCTNFVLPKGMLAALRNQAVVLEKLNRGTESLKRLKQARSLAARLSDAEAEVRMLIAQAQLMSRHSSTADYPRALELLDESERIRLTKLPRDKDLAEAIQAAVDGMMPRNR